MNKPPPRPPWYRRPLTPRWAPGWLLACLLSGVVFAVAAAYMLRLDRWQAHATAFACGFGFVLVILSMVHAPPESDWSLAPPGWVRGPVLALLLGLVIYSWLDKQLRQPAPANLPRPEYALWMLWGCAAWFAFRLLWIAWTVVRSLRAGGAIIGHVLHLGTLGSLVAGGAAGYAAVVYAWPQAQQGWRQIFPWLAVLPGAAAGVVLDFYLELRKAGVVSWLLSWRLPHYRAQLAEADPGGRVQAARAIANMGRRAAPALPELFTALADDSADVRTSVARAIYFIDADDPNLSAELRPRLNDADLRVRVFATATLVARQALPAAEALPALSEGVLTADDEISHSAAHALMLLGPQAAPALPALRRALLEKQPPNCSAADALGALGEAGVLALADALTHADVSVRWTAALVLKNLGPAARPAKDALLAALADRDEQVRRTVARALYRVDSGMG